MKLFLSWSGERSKALATELKVYIPTILQSVEPWFSPDDIDKGAPWLRELSGELKDHDFGILCVTPENIRSPWLLFEAGALSKAVGEARVCPVLLDIEPTELSGPLSQFQATRLNKEDMRKLLDTLNRASSPRVGDAAVDRLHDLLWDDFQKTILNIPKPSTPSPVPRRTEQELLSEVVERVRLLDRKWESLETLFRTVSIEPPYWGARGPRVDDERAMRLANFRKLAGQCEDTIRTLENALSAESDEGNKLSLEKALAAERIKDSSYQAEIARLEKKIAKSRRYAITKTGEIVKKE